MRCPRVPQTNTAPEARRERRAAAAKSGGFGHATALESAAARAGRPKHDAEDEGFGKALVPPAR